MDEKCKNCPYIERVEKTAERHEESISDHESRIADLESDKKADKVQMKTMGDDVKDIKRDMKELTKIPGRLLVAAGGSVLTALLLAGLYAGISS